MSGLGYDISASGGSASGGEALSGSSGTGGTGNRGFINNVAFPGATINASETTPLGWIQNAVIIGAVSLLAFVIYKRL